MWRGGMNSRFWAFIFFLMLKSFFADNHSEEKNGSNEPHPKHKTHGCPYSDLLVLPKKAQQASSTFGHFFLYRWEINMNVNGLMPTYLGHVTNGVLNAKEPECEEAFIMSMHPGSKVGELQEFRNTPLPEESEEFKRYTIAGITTIYYTCGFIRHVLEEEYKESPEEQKRAADDLLSAPVIRNSMVSMTTNAYTKNLWSNSKGKLS